MLDSSLRWSWNAIGRCHPHHHHNHQNHRCHHNHRHNHSPQNHPHHRNHWQQFYHCCQPCIIVLIIILSILAILELTLIIICWLLVSHSKSRIIPFTFHHPFHHHHPHHHPHHNYHHHHHPHHHPQVVEFLPMSVARHLQPSALSRQDHRCDFDDEFDDAFVHLHIGSDDFQNGNNIIMIKDTC